MLKFSRNLTKQEAKKFLLFFGVFFAGILSGDQTELEKIGLFLCKISNLIHLERTRGPQKILMQNFLRKKCKISHLIHLERTRV